MKVPLTATIVAVAALILGGVAAVTYCQKPWFSPVSGHRLAVSNTIKPDPAAVALTNALAERLPKPGIRLGHPHTGVTPEQDHGFALSKPRPLYLGEESYGQPLLPGVYQTHPYSIILGVPRRGIDNGILGTSSSTNGFNMPVIKPRVEAIPKT